MNEATTDALNEINRQIAANCKIAGRNRDAVHLIAVSKTRSAHEITYLLNAGQRVFGENRVQEAEEKWPALKSAFPDVELHLIGQLQSNKANEAVAMFDTIHSLDRMSLVKALGKTMREQSKTVPCFVQVNIGAEEQKGGCAIAEIPELLAAAKDEGIPITGLMCLPPADIEPAPFLLCLPNWLHGTG